MGRWTLDDIPWDRFDPARVDVALVPAVKAASMVEYNGGEYAKYLCSVFHDDPEFQAAALAWAEEEIQHGLALRRWAELADPSFSFETAFPRFAEKITLPVEAASSVRGSRSGELIARCMVETGTSSYYAALGEATEEPALRAVCKQIAADELRHYKLFYDHLNRYLEREGLGFWGRLRVALGRLAESEDDELAYAYYAANLLGHPGAPPYDRSACIRAYFRRAYGFYRRHHVERAVAMIFKAVGLKPHSRLMRAVLGVVWWAMQRRARRWARREPVPAPTPA